MSKFITFGSSPVNSAFGVVGFPELLAKKLNREYINKIKAVNSNNKICRQVLTTEYNQGDVVFVSWTSCTRFEFRTEHGWSGTNLSTTVPGTFDETWYNGPGQWEYTMVLNTIKEMFVAQSFLNNAGVEYCFTFDCDDLIETWLYQDPEPYIKAIKNLINWDNFITFDDHGFIPWAKLKNYLILHGNHTGQEAHNSAADYLLNNTNLKNYKIAKY